MRDTEAIAAFFTTVSAVCIVFMILHHKHRIARLQTIQKAIEAHNVDDVSRRALLDLLANEGNSMRTVWNGLARGVGRIGRPLAFIGGWLTFSIGGVMWVVMGFGDLGSSRDVQAAAIATAIGFGFVTLPLALREYDARRAVGG